MSPLAQELYEYEKGSFKAYPSNKALWSFYSHHTLKILPKDEVCVRVMLNHIINRYLVIEVLLALKQGWIEISAPAEVERLLLEQNK